MKMKCPKCGESAKFTVAAAVEDDEFNDKNNDWKLTCDCGVDVEGKFSRLHRIVLTILFLIPVSLFWGIFLIYADKISANGLRFVVWLLHLFIGFCLSLWVTTKYGSMVIRKRAVKLGFDL